MHPRKKYLKFLTFALAIRLEAHQLRLLGNVISIQNSVLTGSALVLGPFHPGLLGHLLCLQQIVEQRHRLESSRSSGRWADLMAP